MEEPKKKARRGKKELLTREQERELIARAQAGDIEARNHMVEMNLGLAASMARKCSCRSLTTEDLIQEGVLGLIAAIERFDLDKGTKFSTYATHWVRQAIGRAIESCDRMIRLPSYGCGAEQKVIQTAKELENKLEREATVDEVACASGVQSHVVYAILANITDPISLSTHHSGGAVDNIEIVDFIADQDATCPENNSLASADRDKLVSMIEEILPERWAKIILYRFGFIDNQPHSLQEIGDHLGMSREGVRQIEVKAIRKLRHAMKQSGEFQVIYLSSSVLPWSLPCNLLIE